MFIKHMSLDTHVISAYLNKEEHMHYITHGIKVKYMTIFKEE